MRVPAGLQRLWARWLQIVHVIGTFQARVLLSLFYFVIVPVFAALVKLLRDPLDLGSRPRSTFWSERTAPPTPDSGRRQH